MFKSKPSWFGFCNRALSWEENFSAMCFLEAPFSCCQDPNLTKSTDGLDLSPWFHFEFAPEKSKGWFHWWLVTILSRGGTFLARHEPSMCRCCWTTRGGLGLAVGNHRYKRPLESTTSSGAMFVAWMLGMFSQGWKGKQIRIWPARMAARHFSWPSRLATSSHLWELTRGLERDFWG